MQIFYARKRCADILRVMELAVPNKLSFEVHLDVCYQQDGTPPQNKEFMNDYELI